MHRIHPLPAHQAPETVAALYEAVRQDLSLVPNLIRTLGNSRASLDAYLKLYASLANGNLPSSLREKLALRIAKLNGCDYCLAIHHAIGGMLGVPEKELVAAEGGLRHLGTGRSRPGRGRSRDPRKRLGRLLRRGDQSRHHPGGRNRGSCPCRDEYLRELFHPARSDENRFSPKLGQCPRSGLTS